MKRKSLRLHLEQLEDRTLLSSPGDVEWLRQFGSFRVPDHLDPARSVVANGDVYVAGDVDGAAALPGQTSAGGQSDAYLRKYDADGTELWTRQFGTDSADWAFGIAADGSGVYVTGLTFGTLPGQISAGSGDAYLRKYDPDGNELWTRQFGTAGFDQANGIAVAASGLYVTGNTTGSFPGQTSAGGEDAFVRKYDLNGTELWTRQFGTAGYDPANGIAADASGVYVTGSTEGALPGQTSAGGEDAFVRKYDANGFELWTRQFGTASTDLANGIAADASGVYVAGGTGGVFPGQTGTGFDAFVRKYDASGLEVWTRQFNVSGNATILDLANSIAVDASGVYVAGIEDVEGGHQAFLRKYDAAGTEVWTRQFSSELFGNPDQVEALGVAADASGVYVAGDTLGIFPGQTAYAGEKSYVRKYDADGNEVWTREFTAVVPEHDFARAVDVDANGNAYVAGYVGGTLDGSPTFGGAFLRKYDDDGNELWTRQFGASTSSFGQNADSALAVATDGSDVYVVGFVFAALPGQISAGGHDAFVRKYDSDGNELWTRQFGSSEFAGEATAVAVDGSAVYVAGITLGALAGQTSAGGDDAFVRKYDNAGNVLWTRQFGTSGADQVTGLAADPSGIYLSGFTGGTLPGQTSVGGQDAFVRRFDADGNVLWTSQFGTAATDSATGIAMDASGVYVSGFTGGALVGQISTGSDDAFLLKYNATGTVLWTRQFGSAGADQATGVAVGASGIYVAGFTDGALPGKTSAGDQDAFVSKYDSNGVALWTGQFGTDGADQATGVAVSTSGLFVAGFTTGAFPGATDPGLEDVFVAKIVDNISNTPPSNLVLAPSASSINENGTVTLNGSFTDPDAADTHTVVIDWGSGEGTTTLNLAAGVTTFSASHLYLDDNPTGTASDIYPINVTVSDASATTSASTNVTVNNVAPVVIITGPASGSVFTVGTPITFAGAFTDAGTLDTHSAQWTFDTVTLAGSLTQGSGSGSVSDSYTFSASGVYSVKLTVVDDDGGAGSDLVVITIITQPTSTSLSSSDSASVFGESVTFTATVGVTGGGSGIPTGTVQFRVDGSDFGSPVTLVNGTVSFSTDTLSAAPHTITAVYSGDDLFAASTSDALNQVVNQAATATVVSVSAPTPLLGMDSLTLTAIISVVAPGSGNPTGTVTFYDGTSVLGTADLVAGAASLSLGNAALGAGPHVIRAVYTGDGNFAGSDSTTAVNVLAPSTIQGLVYVDANNNGQVDFGEMAITGVTVTLTGIDDLGHAVSRTVQTDANGVYAFINLRPSDAAGYTITETQPAGFLDGQDTLGTVNGVPVGSNPINDVFSGIVLSQGGLLAENYNFGELPPPSGGVGAGQTATIGYWQNRNGQSLILALNGGAAATQLGHWLATTFPNMYATLDGMTNSQVAAYYKTLFARNIKAAPGGPPKVDAQVLATAFAVYVTNQTLAGTTAAAFGFQVSATGVGTQTFNVDNNGAAFGVTNKSILSVMDLLLAVNARSHNGLLYDQDGDGQISTSEASLRTMANNVFSGINEAGDIMG